MNFNLAKAKVLSVKADYFPEEKIRLKKPGFR